MRHPHYASTPADSGQTGSARQSLGRPIDQAGQVPQRDPSTPSAMTESRLEYTFSGGYAENPDNQRWEAHLPRLRGPGRIRAGHHPGANPRGSRRRRGHAGRRAAGPAISMTRRSVTPPCSIATRRTPPRTSAGRWGIGRGLGVRVPLDQKQAISRPVCWTPTELNG